MQCSCTAVATYATCELKYRLLYVDRVRRSPTIYHILGTHIHSVLRFIHSQPLLTPSEEEAIKFFLQLSDSGFYGNTAEKRSAIMQGIEMIRRYYADTDVAGVRVIATELPVRFSAGSAAAHCITGRIDRIDATKDGYEVIDYKTSRHMMSPQEQKRDLQLTLYARAVMERYADRMHATDSVSVSLYYVRTGTIIRSQRTRSDIKRIDTIVDQMAQSIQQSVYHPRPGSICAHCEVRQYCPEYRTHRKHNY